MRSDALKLAEETLEKLQTGEASLTQIVLRGLRIAQLLQANDALIWMRLELRGYSAAVAGTPNWGRYAAWSGRESSTPSDGQQQLYWLSPIEQIESDLSSARLQLESIRLPSVMPSSSPTASPYSTSDAQKILLSITADRATLAGTISRWSKVVATLRGSITDWLSRVVVELKYGEVVDSVYFRMRDRFDALLSGVSEVSAALAASTQRADSSHPEEWSQAAASCRRALEALADHVAPAQETPAPHLTKAAYRNRLAEFVKSRAKNEGRGRLILAEVDATESRCKALDELANKGVHDEISKDELQVTIVHLYLLAGEILALAGDSAEQPPPMVTAPTVSDVSAEGTS